MSDSIFGPVVLFSTSTTILSADSDLLTVVCLRIFALLFSLPNMFFLHIFAWPNSLPTLKSFSSVQSLSHVQLFATPWTAACQASNLYKMSIFNEIFSDYSLNFAKPTFSFMQLLNHLLKHILFFFLVYITIFHTIMLTIPHFWPNFPTK